MVGVGFTALHYPNQGAAMSSGATVIGIHEGGINRLVSDGEHLYTGGRDGSVRTWSRDGEAAPPLDVGDPVFALAVSDGVYAGSDELVGPDGATIHEAEEEVLTTVAVRGERVFVTSDLEQVALYVGEELVWTGDTYKWAYGAAFSPDGSQIAAWTWDTNLYRWDAEDGTVLADDSVNALSAAGYLGGPIFAGAWLDDTRIALGGPVQGGGFASVWDTVNGEHSHRLATPSAVHAIAWHRAGILLGCDDGTVLVWDLQTDEVTVLRLPATLPAAAEWSSGYPDPIEFDVVQGPNSVVALARLGDDVAVATVAGALLLLDVEAAWPY